MPMCVQLVLRSERVIDQYVVSESRAVHIGDDLALGESNLDYGSGKE